MFNYDRFTKADSIDEFNRLVDEKCERCESPYSGESIIFVVDNDDKLTETMKYAEENDKKNLKFILNELKENRGKKVRDLGDIEGILEAIEITCEDYYYVIKKEDGNKVCSSCVGHIEIIN